MRKSILAVLILTAGVLSAEGVESPQSKSIRVWKWSLAVVAAGNAADIATSVGRRELNPVLGGGTFGVRATGIKIGLSTVAIGVQYLVVRRKPEAAKKLAYVNFGAGAVLGGTAAYNARH